MDRGAVRTMIGDGLAHKQTRSRLGGGDRQRRSRRNFGVFKLSQMSQNSSIQWCDSTINPLMGCDGCPLFPPSPGVLVKGLVETLVQVDYDREACSKLVKSITAGFTQSDFYRRRHEIVEAIGMQFPLDKSGRTKLTAAIASEYRCYAAILHMRHGEDPSKPEKKTNKGYASLFESPKLFPGRTTGGRAVEIAQRRIADREALAGCCAATDLRVRHGRRIVVVGAL
jgi:hypothetical protein